MKLEMPDMTLYIFSFPDECEMMVTLEDNPQYAELNIIGTMLIAPNHDDYLKAYQSNEFFKDTDLLNRLAFHMMI